MKARVIVDNLDSCGLKGEWGLAIYIEYNGKAILLDTGASALFAENANALGVDLEGVDMAVLSHAHFDHADGMETFFNVNSKAKFYLQAECAENCYKKFFVVKKYIGIKKGTLEKIGNRIEYVNGDYQITDGVSLISHKMPGRSALGKREKMYVKRDGQWLADDFSHEQSLVFETERGLVVFNSCSHAGAYNIISEVMDAYPGKKIIGLIGGFHLFNKSDDEVQDFALKLKEYGIEYVCTGHCTGKRAYDILETVLGDALHQLHVGLEMEF